jgi:hypothetical protein
VGDRSHASFVAGNLAGAYSLRMDHPGMERVLADPMWRSADWLYATGMRMELCMRRGDRTGAEAAMDEAREAAAGITDPQSQLGLERAEASLALLEGRGRDVFEVGRRHFRETSFAPALSASIAIEGACIAGDPDLLDEAADMAASLVGGPLHGVLQEWVEGIRLIVRGETEEALPMLDRTIERTYEQGLRWITFEMMVMAARHLPVGHPIRQVYIDRARTIAEETDAPGLSAWIDLMVG